MKQDDKRIPTKKEDSTALHKLGELLATQPKIPKIGSAPFGFSYDTGLGFAHNFALDIAKEVLQEISYEKIKELHFDITDIFYQWKDRHGRFPSPPTRGLLSALFSGDTSEPEKELSESERLAQIQELYPWQCHPQATTPIALFNQLFCEDYKPLKDYLDNRNNWNNYHYIQALLIWLSHNPDSEYQNSDCIYEGMKLGLWQLQHKKGIVNRLMPDALAMWKAREKSRVVREAKKNKKNIEIDAKVSAAYKSFCKDGNTPSAIQRHIQRETGFNQTEVSRSMARLGLSTRKKKELQD